MKLKTLEIKHKDYWSDKPTSSRYVGKISFFNDNGAELTIPLTENLIAEIAILCAGIIKTSAAETATSIIASVNNNLQIEGVKHG